MIEECVRQLARASGAEDRARGLSTLRRALDTALKTEGATPEIISRLEALEAAALALYEEVKDQSVRQAVRMLGNVRMAMVAQVGQPEELVDVDITKAEEDGGAVVGSIKVPARRVAQWPKDSDGTPVVRLRFRSPGEVSALPEDEGGNDGI